LGFWHSTNAYVKEVSILEEGTCVEIIHKDFEFNYKGQPSGHYARGELIKWYDEKLCLIELFCNGQRYRVDTSLITLKELEEK